MTLGLSRSIAVPRRPALMVGLGATVLFLVAACFAPTVVLRGWLVGFTAAGAAPLGAVALLAIHGLTGGRWGDVARPALLRAAAGLPVLLLGGLPLLIGLRFVYPWAADPGAAGPGVAALYLNGWFFAARSAVVLGGLWWFAILARRGPLGMLPAGLCLLLYGVGMNLLAFDWLLSLDPHFNSSAFGVQLIATQFVAALSAVILATPAPPSDKAWGDFGALLLATQLGVLYLIFMTFLIDWYGDLPDQAAWYLVRSRHGWLALEIGGLVMGNMLPLLALLVARVRQSPSRLRVVAVLSLAGVLSEMLWLVAPSVGGWAVLAGGLAAIAVGALLVGIAGQGTAAAQPDAWSLADGV